jgi:uncharacterized membrane protein YeaQ/YmgE (transglycosylase-associated protein family)
MIWALFIGLLVGIVAKMLMPGKDPGGFIITALLGIAGAAFGHWIGLQMGMYQENEPVGFITSVVGAMLILFIYRLAVRRKA